MQTTLSKKLLATSVAATTLYLPIAANSQEGLDSVIDEIRDQAARTLGPDRLGAGYAAMINFAINPDISTASYDIKVDGGDDATLDVYRLPLHHVFEVEGQDWRPFVQANFAYQVLKDRFDITEGESVDGKWRAYGGSLATGAEFPVGEALTLIPAISAGIVRLENDAKYRGPLSTQILKPALEGLVFDWDADAWVAGASIAAEYQRSLSNYELNVHGSLTHNYIETYDSSSGLIDFDSRATTFNAQAETVHPTTLSLGGYPLALVTHIGNTTFLGSDRDALGFEYFFEAGLALEADVSAKEWPVQKLRLGAKAIYGEDVTGWSLIFGYRF